jgi:uncharacterized membrane protein required for colicin V production
MINVETPGMPAGTAPRTAQTVVLFVALTLAAVGLVIVSAYWHHDGAEAFGYLGGGMFGAALTYLLLTTAARRRDAATESPPAGR